MYLQAMTYTVTQNSSTKLSAFVLVLHQYHTHARNRMQQRAIRAALQRMACQCAHCIEPMDQVITRQGYMFIPEARTRLVLG